MKLPQRKRTRLKDYDYSSTGEYFVTICTHNKRCIFSSVVGQGLAPAEIQLSAFGEIVNRELLDLENRYDNIKINKYVIMPNHIHAIIEIDTKSAGASPCPTLSDIICTFKSIVTRKCHIINSKQKMWQTSFYDHIIRDESDYLKIWNYIDTNPAKWSEDKFYIE
ncbi:MAG: transposase [Oscillospiraceae bacterium]|nr:transposase [Oscillospiraceae bacterium]